MKWVSEWLLFNATDLYEVSEWLLFNATYLYEVSEWFLFNATDLYEVSEWLLFNAKWAILVWKARFLCNDVNCVLDQQSLS